MNYREITIGRSKNCDIYLNNACKYASNMHGILYYDGNHLMFKDTSTNGTMINNINVKNRAVPVKYGDVIMLAGRYLINWNQIEVFFPYTPATGRNMGTVADINSIDQYQQIVQTPDLTDWNWGAFGVYPVWGFTNGCWWAILVCIFFGWFYPIPNMIFGFYGNRWAWNNRNWHSCHDFEQTQKIWAGWGIVFSAIGIAFWFFSILSIIVSL